MQGFKFDFRFLIILPIWIASNLIWTTASQYDPTNYVISASRFSYSSDFNLYAYFHSVGTGLLTGFAIWTKIPFGLMVATLLWFATCQVLEVFSKLVNPKVLVTLGILVAFFGSVPLLTTQLYSDWSGYFVASLLIRGFFQLQKNDRSGITLISVSILVGTLSRPEFLFISLLIFLICVFAFFFRAHWQGLVKSAFLVVVFSFALQCGFLFLQTGFIGTSIPTSSQVLKIENLILPHIVSTEDTSIIRLKTESMSKPLQSFSQELIRINGSDLFRVDLIPLQISTTLFSLYGQNPKEVANRASNLSGDIATPIYDMFSNGKNFLITDRKSVALSSIQALPFTVNSVFFPSDLYAAWTCDDPLAQILLFNRIRWGDRCPYEELAPVFRNISRAVSMVFLLLILLSFPRFIKANSISKLKLAATAAVLLIAMRLLGFSLALGIYHSTSTRFLSWVAPCVLFFAVSFFLRGNEKINSRQV